MVTMSVGGSMVAEKGQPTRPADQGRAARAERPLPLAARPHHMIGACAITITWYFYVRAHGARTYVSSHAHLIRDSSSKTSVSDMGN